MFYILLCFYLWIYGTLNITSNHSLFALNHLFKNSSSIFCIIVKIFEIRIDKYYIVTSSNGTGLDLSLIDFIDFLCTGEEVKIVKLFLLKFPDYESYI
jgi:hypothetical protein